MLSRKHLSSFMSNSSLLRFHNSFKFVAAVPKWNGSPVIPSDSNSHAALARSMRLFFNLEPQPSYSRKWSIHAMASSSLSKMKPKKSYVCTECGESYAQWWGECSNCGHENTIKQITLYGTSSNSGGGPAARAITKFSEQQQVTSTGNSSSRAQGPGLRRGSWVQNVEGEPQKLSEVSKESLGASWRMKLTGDGGEELSRVLGGGVVPGSLILVGGDPGVGKSTLLLQVAGQLSQGSNDSGAAPVLYVSGEESVQQVSSRAERMGISAELLYLYSATNMESILEWIQRLSPRAVVVDSIQTVFLSEATGSAGSTSQVRECATALLHAAKSTGTAIFLVGHVTKSGDIAGPKVLEHIVDVVLYMEGERLQSHRLIRGVKNRYGATDEVGVFEMLEEGLVAVPNPSALFLSERQLYKGNHATAASVAVIMQGTRPILMEVQALCSRVPQPPGRRMTTGVDSHRMPLLFAILSKQAKLNTFKHDVFINVVGGLQLKETGADLAIAMAVASSLLEVPIPEDITFVGELGLHGELRSVGQVERRINEAAKLGFGRCIVPVSHGQSVGSSISRKDGTQVIRCGTLVEVIRVALGVDTTRSQNDETD